MQHHGLGHLPQPDNFTTCGRLGIEVNQYNNPIECYADETIDDMREEKVIVDHPELAEKMLKGNTQVGQIRLDKFSEGFYFSETQGAPGQPNCSSEVKIG